MQNRFARLGLWSAKLLIVGALILPARGEEPSSVIRDGFETPKVSWRQEQTDATVKIFAHDRTNRAAHEGLLSEGFQFEAGVGGGLYYSYRLPNIPVTDELKVGLYLRSNKSGAQILGRVVLPSDIDADSGRPSFVLVPGSMFEAPDRWQKLELADMLPAIERQARVLRASTKRKVSLEGAYLERLVVNIYGGEGETEVYLDELTVGPVPADLANPPAPEASRGGTARTIADRPRTPTEPLEAVPSGLNTRIKLDRNRLTKDGFPWFFTAIRSTVGDPASFRQIGFDAMVVPKDTPEATVRAAIASGLLLIPELTGEDDRIMPEADQMASEATSFLGRDAVAFWSLGENLGQSPNLAARNANKRRVREAMLAIRKAKPGGSPLTTATVSGMLTDYARIPENLDLIGIPAAWWGTTQDPMELFQYFDQRRLLTARSNADALFWATIEASPPPVYQEQIWGTGSPPSWGIPRVQPEQLRTATYAALSAGFRGICFRTDEDLDRGLGRMNRIEMAFLNEEIDLFEPILADPDKSVRQLDAYQPDPPPPPPISLFQVGTSSSTKPPTPKELPPNGSIKVAAITTKDRRGVLLVVTDYFKYGQFQPPQSAVNNLILRVPAPSDAHAYLISPGGVQTLKSTRVPGGIEMPLADFGVTALVLVTTNVELKDQIERAVNAVRPYAVALAIEQAEIQRSWVGEIDSMLQDDKHVEKDSVALLNKSTALIQSAQEALAREDYQTAWDEARRASRPLRILMRYHFMAAYDAIIKDLRDEDLPCGPVPYEGIKKPQSRLIAPIVVPSLCSFNTLPKAWIWEGWIKSGRLGRNLVETGDFNDPDTLKNGWTPVSYQTEDIIPEIRLNKGGLDKGTKDQPGRNLFLDARLRKGVTVDTIVPFFDHPVVAIRSPAVKVGANRVYRISVMVYLIHQAVPGAGGVIVRDSLGGERLQYRTPQALNEWFEVVYYRKAPADGNMTVTLGLAGTGWAAFDDLKIQAIEESIDPEQLKLMASRRRRQNPSEKPTTDPDATPARPAAAARPRQAPIRQ